MIRDDSLQLVVRKTGKAWWKPAYEVAQKVALQQLLERLPGEDRFEYRRMGKTFQACLLAIRHMLKGERVSFRVSDSRAEESAYKQCLEILNKSFIEIDRVWVSRTKPSHSISLEPLNGCIQFCSHRSHESGFHPQIVIEDFHTFSEVNWAEPTCPKVVSVVHLLNILKNPEQYGERKWQD